MGWNFNKLLSYLKSTPWNLSNCIILCKEKNKFLKHVLNFELNISNHAWKKVKKLTFCGKKWRLNYWFSIRKKGSKLLKKIPSSLFVQIKTMCENLFKINRYGDTLRRLIFVEISFREINFRVDLFCGCEFWHFSRGFILVDFIYSL